MKGRRFFSKLAVWGMGYSGAEGGRYWGVTTSAVNRLALSERLADLGKYLKLFQYLRPPGLYSSEIPAP